MICEAFIMAWNEADTIELTIKHYQRFCDRVTLLDNYSTDGTVAIAKAKGCEVIQFGEPGVLDDQEYLKIKNKCYWGSKAKFVIVCDADEILYHPDLRRLMETTQANAFNTLGWDVFSNDMPENDFLEIQTGMFQPNYCKKVIFSPKLIINFQYGCHVAKPLRRPRADHQVLTLFHYRNIGGYDRLSKRHEQYRARMSDNNKRIGLGCHYQFPEEQRKREWYEKYTQSIPYTEWDRKGVDPFPFKTG